MKLEDSKKMEIYTDLCCSFSVPLWVAPLLRAAARLKTDPARRRKVYRLIQRQLVHHKVGCHNLDKPTYIYPAELKQMIRTAFPGDICDYQDPCHDHVFIVSMDDLKRVSLSDQD